MAKDGLTQLGAKALLRFVETVDANGRFQEGNDPQNILEVEFNLDAGESADVLFRLRRLGYLQISGGDEDERRFDYVFVHEAFVRDGYWITAVASGYYPEDQEDRRGDDLILPMAPPARA